MRKEVNVMHHGVNKAQEVEVTPQLIKELQTFESRKPQYLHPDEKYIHNDAVIGNQTTFSYYFRHPNLRLLVAFSVIILNFYMFAEDPVSHSVTDCKIVLIGNVYSMLFTKYPSNGYSLLKVVLWLFAFVFGAVVGRVGIHYWLFCSKLKLKMFSKEGQGSWMVVFLFTLCTLYYHSRIYNSFLVLSMANEDFFITENLGIENKTFMKLAAIGTWLGDFFTLWMVLDMMLQENRYPEWLPRFCRWWNKDLNRVVAFWTVAIVMTTVVVVGITTDFVQWDEINKGFGSTNELARSYLASLIFILDLLIIMQDWDFPHFCGTQIIKLPGFHSDDIIFKLPDCLSIKSGEINMSGKWFNYGIIFIVMILDLNMLRNQITYNPYDYGQYVDKEGHIFTVRNKTFLSTANETMLSFTYRWGLYDNNTKTSQSMPGRDDHMVLSTYQGFNKKLNATALIPTTFVFLLFLYLIYTLAKNESKTERLVRNWFESKFVKKRKTAKVSPEQEMHDEEKTKTVRIEKATVPSFNYYFQHPYIRLLVVMTNMFLTWYHIAEDPIGHSFAQAKADVMGNNYSLLFGSTPNQPEFWLLKISILIFALITTIFVGKYLIHQLLLQGVLRLHIFDNDHGSWLVQIAIFIPSLYCWSLVYNKVIETRPQLQGYVINSKMELSFHTFMKGVALVSFLSHFILTLMIVDTMLQEEHYPTWAQSLRRLWRVQCVRIATVWVVGVSVTTIAIVVITLDVLQWNELSTMFPSSNELARTKLAAFIFLFDVLVLTQDWEFPWFHTNPKVNLPGFYVNNFHFKFCCIHLHFKGRWFTYGLILVALIVDVYNLKNQMNYKPIVYEQFTDQNNAIVTITNKALFMHGDISILHKNVSLYQNNTNILKLNTKYLGTKQTDKGTALIWIAVSVLVLVVFGFKRNKEEEKRKENTFA